MLDDQLTFLDDLPENTSHDDSARVLTPWRVLVVDDDEDVYRLTRINLQRLRFRGRSVEVLFASSCGEALELMARENDIALALIDVVMETETAGIDLVKAIRSDIGQRDMRLILRTGQPGLAPEQDIILNYEIDGYVAKSEMTSMQLFTLVVAALRAYETIHALTELTVELEMRVAARTADLEKLAMLDALTGIANRRHFEMRAEVEITQARRHQWPLSLVMLDVDHFKNINDTHGHAVGDEVLKQMMGIVAQQIRSADLLARFGGEEFVLLLPESDLSSALNIAQRICLAIAMARFHVRGISLQVTASLGVTTLEVNEPDDLAAALERVDQALYRAKAAGRNCVLSR